MTIRWTRREALAMAATLALPLDFALPSLALAADPPGGDAPVQPAAGRQPDLGNLHAAIDWIAKDNAPQLSFLDARWKSLDEWKQAARPVYRQHLAYDPKPLPL